MCRSTGALADLHLGTCLFPAWLPGTRNTLRRASPLVNRSVATGRIVGFGLNHARAEISRSSGVHFDPAVVDVSSCHAEQYQIS
jgi:hypothetical protein